MNAVIMAGGKGTRVQSITSDIPKPMIPVLGKPILEYQIESLKRSGIEHITVIVGHLGNVIKEYFGNGENWAVDINYITEEKPLGTAGALFYLKGELTEDFVLVFGDLMLDVDWNRFMSFHKEHGGYITLYGHPNAHPFDSDVIVTDKNNKVLGIDSKNNTRDYYYHNFVNAGLYCINPKMLELIEKEEKIDLEKDLTNKLISKSQVYAYNSTEYVKDMGTPDRYYSVSSDVEKGIVNSRSLRNKQKCIFLDRDGTLNVHKGFLKNADDLQLLPGVSEAIKQTNESEYLAIVATNQPVIARGECSFEELDNIHMKLETELGKTGAFLNDIYFCPHHPHKGYEGEILELKFDCDCRKPKIGMLTKAAEQYNINLSDSWYVGDTTMDIKTGINAGMHTVLVQTGESGKDGKYNVCADYIATDFIDAVNFILSYKK